jgi:hypothetical protein
MNSWTDPVSSAIIHNEDEFIKTKHTFPRQCVGEAINSHLDGKKALFIRDSFLDELTPLLNHSFAHTVYLEHNTKTPEHRIYAAINKYEPDIVLIALQETSLINFLLFGLAEKSSE